MFGARSGWVIWIPSSSTATTTLDEPVTPAAQAVSAPQPNWLVVPSGPTAVGLSSLYMPHSEPAV